MQGTTADLKQGDRISLYDLLFALMLPSGNDAALALAEYFGKMVCKSQEPEKFCSSSLAIRCFVEEMNSVAKDL
jgi:D-alanyl-D-alanine carboxypeptidase (penicillin-binding protein 5/6)